MIVAGEKGHIQINEENIKKKPTTCIYKMGQARLERNVRYIFPIYLAIYNIESDPTFKKVWHKYMQIIKKVE